MSPLETSPTYAPFFQNGMKYWEQVLETLAPDDAEQEAWLQSVIDTLEREGLLHAEHVRHVVAHRVHRVMGLVAVKRPVAFDVRDQIGTMTTQGTVELDSQ